MTAIEQSPSHPQVAAAGEPAVLTEWTVHLARRQPARAAAAAAAVALAAALGWLQLHSLLFAAAGALMLLSAAAEYLFPIRYRLTLEGAYAAYGAARLEIAWGRVRRVGVSADAVRLSPLPAASRLDAFRGVTLRFAPEGAAGSRAEVMSILWEHSLCVPIEGAPRQ